MTPIMKIDDQTGIEKLKYNINREAEKISALQLEKYYFLKEAN